MKTACEHEDVFKYLHARKLDFMQQHFGDADRSRFGKLAEALYCICFARDRCAENVYPSFEKQAFHLAPAFRSCR